MHRDERMGPAVIGLTKLAVSVAAVALIGGSAVALTAAPAAATVETHRAAFYYNWFPETEHWASQYTPALGKYDSSNPTILAAQMQQMRWAGIDTAIASWWGAGSRTDQRMPAVLAAAEAVGESVTAYYEPEGTSDPGPEMLANDLGRLGELAQSPAWLRVNGKPVLFVYNANDTSCAVVDRWKAAAPGWYLQLKVFGGYKQCPQQPDSWHQYAPTTGLTKHLPFSENLSPGFWKFNEVAARTPRNLDAFRVNASTMADSGLPWQLVTSFNEFGEGTSIEPTTAWQSKSGMGDYLDALHDVFVLGKRWPTSVPSSTATATSTTATTTQPSTTTATSTTAPTSTTVSSTTAPTSTTTTPPPSGITKAITFVVENHSLDQMRTGMPYLYSQAQKYGHATNWTAIRHPSLPNYLGMAGGSTFGVTDDAAPSAHPVKGVSVFGAAITAGKTAKSYQEGMTSPCKLTNTGKYAVKHNPWAYFVDERALCNALDVATGTYQAGALHDDIVTGNLPNVSEVTPDMCNDAHDCSLAVADAWLKSWLDLIYASPDWQSGQLAVIITADEDNGKQGNKVLTVVAHPSLAGVVVTSSLTHYSWARLMTDLTGAPCIGAGCTAPDAASAFGLTTAGR